MTKDLAKLVVFPLVVGLLLIVAQFVLERYKTTRKVTAVIEGPFAFAQIHELFDKAQISIQFEFGSKKETPQNESTSKLETKGTSPIQGEKSATKAPPASPSSMSLSMKIADINDLQLYRVTIRNTGTASIRDLPVRLVLEHPSDKFQFIALKHKTNPAMEFGEIKDDVSNPSSPRFVYQLLNPGDEDVITLLTSEQLTLNAYAKGEGVSFEVTKAGHTTYTYFSIILAILVGILVGTISSIVMMWRDRRNQPISLYRQ
jgi:hypothetical protein